MTDSDARPSGEDDQPECEHRDCNDDAVAIYEGDDRAGNRFIFVSCNDHAPDLPPLRWVGDRLVTDGGAVPGDAVEHTDSDGHPLKPQVVRALRGAGPVGLSACALAGEVGVQRKPLVEVLEVLERQGVVESHGRPGLGGGQWRLVEEGPSDD